MPKIQLNFTKTVATPSLTLEAPLRHAELPDLSHGFTLPNFDLSKFGFKEDLSLCSEYLPSLTQVKKPSLGLAKFIASLDEDVRSTISEEEPDFDRDSDDREFITEWLADDGLIKPNHN